MWPLPAVAASGGMAIFGHVATILYNYGEGRGRGRRRRRGRARVTATCNNAASLFTILFCPFYVTFTFPPCFPFDCSILLHYFTMGIRSRTPLPYLSSMQWRYQTKLACVDSLTTLPALHTSSPWISVTWIGGKQDGTHGDQLQHLELLQVVISARLSRIYQ